MAILLDHTIVPAKDKLASAKFFAEIFGLNVKSAEATLRKCRSTTVSPLTFADETEPQSHHYAFHISDAEFEAIYQRVKAKGLPYGSGPYNHTDGKIYTRRGGRGFYFEDPNGHLLEVMTVPETGS